MSYEEDLLRDLADDSNEESQEEVELQDGQEDNGDVSEGKTLDENINLEHQIDSILNSSISLQDHLMQLDVSSITDISNHLRIFNIIPALKAKISTFTQEESDFLKLISHSDYDNDESNFFIKINQLLNLINQEVELIFKFIQFKYSVVFPELGSIITNPIDYIKVIQVIKQDLINIKHYEHDLAFLSKDKILILVMSGLSNSKKQFKLNDSDFESILNNCEKIKQLNDIYSVLSNFIQNKLNNVTPNLNNLLGPVTTSKLLIHCGSLAQLASTPSCNLPSIGVKELSSKAKNLTTKSIAMGYLYDNDLIKYLPDDILKPSLRILSGKVILAARIDLSKSDPQGNLGLSYKNELIDKINKLLTPPDSKTDKALPAPMEYKSKRRGGRKIRKMKQKFQMSELAKAQNKFEFGKEEDSVMDQFGEEIGFGIIKNRKFTVNTNTNAKLSKALQNRLNNDNDEKSKHLDSVFEVQQKKDDDFSDIIKPKNKWINSTMKK